MIKNLFRPRHLLDPWRDNFVIALILRNISGGQIGDALAQVDAHCTDSGEEPEEAFGDPVVYATRVAEQVRPVDLALSMSPLRAGMLALAVLFAVPTLLSGVSGLARGGPAELSIGSLVGAGVGTWIASMVGLQVPNSRLKGFEHDLEDGKILLMLDVPAGRYDELRTIIARTHPEAADRGSEPTVPAFP